MAISAPEALAEHHDLEPFDCGKPSLNAWLKTRARSNHERGFTVVTVVHEGNRVIGYYGVAPTAVIPASVPRAIRTGQPPDPVPCLLIAQLATDIAWTGRGVGTGLLKDALIRCVDATRLIGGRAIVVRAVDDSAREFWLRRGFLASKDDPFVLFRSIRDVAASLVAATRRR